MDEVEKALRGMLAEQEATMARLREEKPTVVDAHSDGKRVRYVRAETAAQVIRDVLSMVAGR
ncbi:MAG: hypothetical protein ACOYB2_10940 [Limnohabitans sp.]